MFSKQSTFDLVLSKVREQKVPSVEFDLTIKLWRCWYHRKDGVKCSVGHLIPDYDYNAGMEHRTLRCEKIKEVLLNLGHSLSLVEDLQQAHDSSALPNLFKNYSPSENFLKDFNFKMSCVAKKHKLKYKEQETSLV